MTDTEKMFVKQYLLRVRQEGYSLAEQYPYTDTSRLSINIFRDKTFICTLDDRQLGEIWKLRIRTDDSLREDIKQDYHKLFYMSINLRDLYFLYDNATPLRGYDESLGYRAIIEYNNCTLAVNGSSKLGELEFGTFKTGEHHNGYRTTKTIRDNIYFDMDNYPAARLDFVVRSGLLPHEQLVTPENIEFLHDSCSMTLNKDNVIYNKAALAALGQVVSNLEKVQDSFRETRHRVSAIPAVHAPYMESKILDVRCIFTKHQINRETLPSGLHAYDIQYSRDNMEPDKLWNRVLDRRFGTVITKKPLPIGEKGYTEISNADFSLNPNKRCTLREFQSKGRDAR